jgi:hypothetical protein
LGVPLLTSKHLLLLLLAVHATTTISNSTTSSHVLTCQPSERLCWLLHLCQSSLNK